MKKTKRLSVIMLALVMLLAFVPVITPEASATAIAVTPMVISGGYHTVGLVVDGTV